MKEVIYLRSWDRAARCCQWNTKSNEYRWVPASAADELHPGFAKSTLLSSPIFSYPIDGEWHLRVGNFAARAQDPDLSVITKRGRLVCSIKFLMHHKSCKRFISEFSSRFLMVFDPTHDQLDIDSHDFVSWLAQRVNTDKVWKDNERREREDPL